MNSFDLNRFILVLKKDIFENIKTFSIVIFISYVLFIVFFIFSILPLIFIDPANYFHDDIDITSYFTIGLVLTGCWIAGTSFPAFRKNGKGLLYLSYPASDLEKYLSFLLINIFGFFIIYLLIYFALGTSLKIIAESVNYKTTLRYFNRNAFYEMIPFYFNLTGLFFLGAVWFNKNPIFKTILISIILIYLTFGIRSIVDVIFSNSGIEVVWDSIPNFPDFESKYVNVNSLVEFKIFKLMLYYTMPTFLWLVGYFKFKEKEF